MAAPHINLAALMQQPFAKGIAHAAAASLTLVIGVPWIMRGAPIPHYGPLIGGSSKPVINVVNVPTILGPNTPTWGIFGHPDNFCVNRHFNPKPVTKATNTAATLLEVTPTFNEKDKTVFPSLASSYSGTTVPITDSSTFPVDSSFNTLEGASHVKPLLYLAVPLFFVWVLRKLISKTYNKLHQGGPVAVPPVVISVVQPVQPNRESAVRRKFFYKWRETLRLGQIDRLESRICNLEHERKTKLESRMSREKEIFDRKLADRDILYEGRALRTQKEIDTLQTQKLDLQNQLGTNRELHTASHKELESSLEKKTELCAIYKRLNESNLTMVEKLQADIDVNARQLASCKELEDSLEKKTELCSIYKRLNESNLTTIERLQAEIDIHARELKEERETMDEAELQHDRESHELQLEVIQIANELSEVKDQKLDLDRRLQQAQKEKAELEHRLEESKQGLAESGCRREAAEQEKEKAVIRYEAELKASKQAKVQAAIQHQKELDALNQEIKGLNSKRQQEAENAERKHREEKTSLQIQCQNQLASTNAQHETTLQSRDVQLKSLEQAKKAASDQYLQNIDILKEQHKMQLKREISKEVVKALADQKAEFNKDKADTKAKSTIFTQKIDDLVPSDDEGIKAAEFIEDEILEEKNLKEETFEHKSSSAKDSNVSSEPPEGVTDNKTAENVTATSNNIYASGTTSKATDALTSKDTSAATNGHDQLIRKKEWKQPDFTTPKIDFGVIAEGGNQKALPGNIFAKLTNPSSKASTAAQVVPLGSTATTKSHAFGPNGTNIQLFKIPSLTLEPSNSWTDPPNFRSSTGAFDTNFTAGREITGSFGANQSPMSESERSTLNAENLPITPGSSQGRRRADGKPLTRRAGQNKRNAKAAARALERQSGALGP